MLEDILFQRNFLRIAYRLLLWHIKYTRSKKPFPLACGFYITSKCNFRCEFCNIWRLDPDFQVPKDRAKGLIHQLGKLGLIYLSFSGGEPLLVPYAFDLLAYAKECGIAYTHIVSNGYLMDKHKAQELAKASVSEISFSLDGNPEAHDRNRCMRGAFNRVIAAIEYAKIYSPKTKIVLNTILDPLTPENAAFAVKKAEQLRVRIKIQPMSKHPSFGIKESNLNPRQPLGKDNKQRLLEAIDKIQNSPYLSNSRAFLENYKAFMFCPENLILAEDDCIYGYHHIEFFANRLFPCLEGCDWQEGWDTSHTLIKDIIASSAYRNKLGQLKRCSGCRRNHYVCYYEPRLNFPLWNLVKSRIKRTKISDQGRERFC